MLDCTGFGGTSPRVNPEFWPLRSLLIAKSYWYYQEQFMLAIEKVRIGIRLDADSNCRNQPQVATFSIQITFVTSEVPALAPVQSDQCARPCSMPRLVGSLWSSNEVSAAMEQMAWFGRYAVHGDSTKDTHTQSLRVKLQP